MWYWLDWVVVTALAGCSACYVVYALGSVRFKRRILELFIRFFGLRIYSFLSPKVSGCNQCSGILRKIPAPIGVNANATQTSVKKAGERV